MTTPTLFNMSNPEEALGELQEALGEILAIISIFTIFFFVARYMVKRQGFIQNIIAGFLSIPFPPLGVAAACGKFSQVILQV